MTTITRPLVGYRDHTVVATPDQLANLIANHTRTGTLLAMGTPHPQSDGRISVTLRLADTTPTPAQRLLPTCRPTTAPRASAQPAVPHPADTSAYPAGLDYQLNIRIRPARTCRHRRTALVVTCIVAALILLVYATGWLLGRLASIPLDGPTLAGILAVALLALAALRRNRSNRHARHCPGCN